MSSFVTEKEFVIAEGENDEIYFFIKAKKAHPDSPIIFYDGGDHALFRRSEDEKIILDYINPQIRERLRKVKEVIMVETILDNIKESYYTPLQFVEKIPVDWQKLGLKTWEEVSMQMANK